MDLMVITTPGYPKSVAVFMTHGGIEAEDNSAKKLTWKKGKELSFSRLEIEDMLKLTYYIVISQVTN